MVGKPEDKPLFAWTGSYHKARGSIPKNPCVSLSYHMCSKGKFLIGNYVKDHAKDESGSQDETAFSYGQTPRARVILQISALVEHRKTCWGGGHPSFWGLERAGRP